MEKICSKCKTSKNIVEGFHRDKKSSTGTASWCKSCANSFFRESRKRNYSTENKRKWQLKTRYGITPELFAEMLSTQNRKCAICKNELTKPHIDHCHNTNIVRGLLCHKCNIRLGGWDDLEWREKALSYLGIST